MIICHMGEIIKKSPYKREYLHKYLKVSPNTLTNWCNGHTYPPADKLFKLAKLLEIPVDHFYSIEEE